MINLDRCYCDLIGNGPDINSTTVGVPQILRANILFDGETTPIEKKHTIE